MSEEFNKEVNRENAADETVHTETSESVQKQMPSGSQPGKGTTYSWVNPKIQQSASNSSSEGTTPWGNGSANSWQTNTRNYGSQSQGQQAQRQGGQQAQSQQYWQAQTQNSFYRNCFCNSYGKVLIQNHLLRLSKNYIP